MILRETYPKYQKFSKPTYLGTYLLFYKSMEF